MATARRREPDHLGRRLPGAMVGRTGAERDGSDWSDPHDFARLAAEHGPDTSVVADPSGAIRWVSAAVEDLLGIERSEQPPSVLFDFLHPDDVASIVTAIDGTCNRIGWHRPLEVRVRAAGGAFVDTEVSTRTLRGPDGVWSIYSIRRVEGRTELANRREALQKLIQSASVECAHARWYDVEEVVEHLLEALCGVFGARQVEVAWANEDDEVPVVGSLWSAPSVRAMPPSRRGEHYESMCLEREGERAVGDTFARDDLAALERCPTAARFVAAGLDAAVEVRLSAGQPRAAMRLAFAGGLQSWDEINAEPVALVGLLVLSTLRRCRAEAELHERARRDPLTGLLNRNELYQALDTTLSHPPPERHIGVLYCDIDGFKSTNDRYGHAAGDAVLTSVAAVLEECVRDGDVVARMGGDEFAAVCRGLESPSQLEAVARRVSSAVSALDLPGVTVRMSVGAVVWDDGQSVDEIIGAADAAMYRQKRTARSGEMGARSGEMGARSGEMGDCLVEHPEQRGS